MFSLPSVVYKKALKESVQCVVISPSNRVSIGDHSLYSSFRSRATFSRSVNHYISQISLLETFSSSKPKIPLERNKVSRRRGNLREYDEAVAHYPQKGSCRNTFINWNDDGLSGSSSKEIQCYLMFYNSSLDTFLSDFVYKWMKRNCTIFCF